MCSRVVISGVVGGSGNPSWNTNGLVIGRAMWLAELNVCIVAS